MWIAIVTTMFIDTVNSEISREFYQQRFAKLKPYRNGEITLSVTDVYGKIMS